jgi:hypothetical protein
MQFAGASACATKGRSFACIGGRLQPVNQIVRQRCGPSEPSSAILTNWLRVRTPVF